MCPPEPTLTTHGRLARYTPDSRQWRYALAGLNAIAAPVLFYYTVRLISSTWSGTLPSLLVLVGSILTLLTAAAAPTILLSPERNSQTQTSTDSEDSAIVELKQQYASGNISEDEFERRLETLITTSTGTGRPSSAPGEPRETVQASADIESELD
jgi:uncharacterized membrane protein